MDAGTMYANAKALHELLQEARAENAKLVMKLNAEHLVRQNLAAENELLRELVRDIWYAYRCEEVAPNVAKHWHDRMRELGVDA